MPSLCLEPLAGWHPEAPRCQLLEAHQLPAGHLGAGQALLSFQKHWPTHLRLGLESQSRVSQECPSQPAPILRPGDENKLLSPCGCRVLPLALPRQPALPGFSAPSPLQLCPLRPTQQPCWARLSDSHPSSHACAPSSRLTQSVPSSREALTSVCMCRGCRGRRAPG